MKIVHFIGPVKPWQHHYIPENGAVVLSPGTAGSQQGAYDFIKRWWEVWNSLEQVGSDREREERVGVEREERVGVEGEERVGVEGEGEGGGGGGGGGEIKKERKR